MRLLNSKQNFYKVAMIDLDGTLVFTNQANNLAYQKAVELVTNTNFPLTNSKRITKDVIKSTFKGISQSDFSRIVELKNKLYKSFLNKTKVCQPMLKIIKMLKDNGMKISLVSNANFQRAISTLEFHNLISYFDDVFCKEKDQQTKFDSVFCGLKVAPNQILVFDNEIKQLNIAKKYNIPSTNLFKMN